MLMTGDAEKKAEKCIIEDVNSMTGDAGEPARLVSVNILKSDIMEVGGKFRRIFKLCKA